LISKFVGALVIGSRGVCGTRTIGKQKRLPRQWKNQIPIAKGQKLPIALQRQQPTRRRDGYAKQWLNAGDKWRSLLRSRKSASQVEVERDTFEFPSAALSCFVILPLRASASCSHVSAISSNCSRCAGGDARARARHSEACCKYSSTFFTRTSPDTPQTRNVRRQERFLTKLSAFICPEDPVADAAWQTLFLSARAVAPHPGFAEGGAPAPSPVVATESPDRAGVQDALLVLIFCYLRLEPQCRLTLCRRNARPILHVVAVVHPRGETGRRS
jgi:hypothetical protein